VSKATVPEGTSGSAPPPTGPLEFRDKPGIGIFSASIFGLGIAGLVLGVFLLLTYRRGPAHLFARPDRLAEFLFQGEGLALVVGLVVLSIGLWALLTSYEVVTIEPARRAVIRRRGYGLHLPARAIPFAVLERAELGVLRSTGGRGRGGPFHFVRVVYRDGRSFRLPGLPGDQRTAERAVRTLNELLCPVG
jgi:hypothetical protein